LLLLRHVLRAPPQGVERRPTPDRADRSLDDYPLREGIVDTCLKGDGAVNEAARGKSSTGCLAGTHIPIFRKQALARRGGADWTEYELEGAFLTQRFDLCGADSKPFP
jgi:hypothetical protein